MPRGEMKKRSQIRESRKSYQRKTKYEKWGGEEFTTKGKTIAQLKKELQLIKRATNRRITYLRKEGVSSVAVERLKEALKGTKPLQKIKKIWEILPIYSAYHSFWESKGSTVAGAREINYEQDKRIFGYIDEDRPELGLAGHLTKEEREEFWAAYMEFENQYKADMTYLDSTRVQRLLGQEFTRRRGKFDMAEALQNVRSAAIEEHNTGYQLPEGNPVHRGGKHD